MREQKVEASLLGKRTKVTGRHTMLISSRQVHTDKGAGTTGEDRKTWYTCEAVLKPQSSEIAQGAAIAVDGHVWPTD